MNIASLLLKIILGIILIITLAIGTIVVLVDPNDYRDKITQIVKKETGRDLHIESIKLSFFPRIGVNLSNASLSNATGFSERAFLEISSVKIGASILPLLRKQLEVDTLTLSGLTLNLEKNSQGVSNWADLIPPAIEATQVNEQVLEPSATENPIQKLAALHFGGIDIHKGKVYWKDQQADQIIELTIHHLKTGAITFGEFFDIHLVADTQIANPQIQTSLDLAIEAKLKPDGSYTLRNLTITTTSQGNGIPVKQATAHLNIPIIDLALAKNHINLPNLTLGYDVIGGSNFPMQTIKGELTLSDFIGDLSLQDFKAKQLSIKTYLTGESLPKGKSKIEFTAQPSINLNTQNAGLVNLYLTALGIQTQGSIKATKITSNPIINAQLDIPQTNLRALLTQLNISLPEMADTATLTKFSASTEVLFNTKSQALHVNNLSINLDDTKLTGNATVSKFNRPNIRYDLALTKIDLNRYLPPKKEIEKTNEGEEDAEIILPTEFLRNLILNGTFKADSIIFDQLNPQNILLTLKATEGKVTANPIQADIFGTQIRAQAALDVSKEIPKYTFKTDAKKIPIGEVLFAFTGKKQITGTGSVNVNISTAGSRTSHFKQNLNGTTNFDLKEGAIKGFNLAGSIRQARAKIGGKTLTESDQKLQTDFSTLIGKFTIKQGIVDTRKLIAKAPFMRISGLGKINLPKESIDYSIRTKIVGTDKGQGGSELKDLHGLTIPIKLKGSWLEPNVSLDIKSILEQKASAEIEKKKQEVVSEAKKKVEEKLKDSIFKGLGF